MGELVFKNTKLEERFVQSVLLRTVSLGGSANIISITVIVPTYLSYSLVVRVNNYNNNEENPSIGGRKVAIFTYKMNTQK